MREAERVTKDCGHEPPPVLEYADPMQRPKRDAGLGCLLLIVVILALYWSMVCVYE